LQQISSAKDTEVSKENNAKGKNEVSVSECDSIDSPVESGSLKVLKLIDKSANTDEKMIAAQNVGAKDGQATASGSMVARLVGTDSCNGGIIVGEVNKALE